MQCWSLGVLFSSVIVNKQGRNSQWSFTANFVEFVWQLLWPECVVLSGNTPAEDGNGIQAFQKWMSSELNYAFLESEKNDVIN